MPLGLIDPNVTVEGEEPFYTEGADLQEEDLLYEPSAERVEALIAEEANTRATRSRRNCQELYNRVASCENLYRGKNRNTAAAALSVSEGQKLDKEVRLMEVANQVDMLVALILEALKASGLYKVVAVNGESQFKADTTKAVIDCQLRDKRSMIELEKFVNRFVKHPIAGVQTCIEYDTWTESERMSVPLGQAPPENGRFIAHDQPDPNGDPVGSLYDVHQDRSQWKYYFEAIDTKCIAFSDLHRPVHQQSSIHRERFLTEEDIYNDPSLINTEKIGDPNGTNRFYNWDVPTTGTEEQPAEAPDGEGTYCITESWFQISFRKWLKTEKCRIEDVVLFCEKHDIPIEEISIPQKWCVKHKDSEAVLNVYPNYMPNKRMFPFEFESFIMGDSDLVGQSFLERIADFDSFLQAMVNLLRKNQLMRLYMSAIATKKAKFEKKDWEDCLQPGAWKKLEGNFEKIDDVLKILEFPDLAPGVMPVIQWIIGMMQSNGLPATLQGIDNSGTATESSLNNANAQKKVASALNRAASNVVKPTLENIRDLTFLNFEEGRWIDYVGENGAVVAKTRYVTPAQITNRFLIAMTGSFDFIIAQQRAQQLIGLINVLAPLGLPVERITAMVEMILEYFEMDRWKIDKITGAEGTRTDPMDEIKTMIENPVAEIKVLPSDNHLMALQLLDAAEQMYPQISGQWNVMKYRMEHENALAQMEAAMAPAGPAKQPPQSRPTNAQGTARQSAQHRSAPDSGPKTSAGMTGRAVQGYYADAA